MYILKNAWVSIVRNKGRNILIAIIILVIAASSSITLAIRNSATKIVNAYENKYNIEASIAMDRRTLMQKFRGEGEDKKSQQEMIETFNNIESLTVDDIIKYGDSKYVSKYYYVYNTGVNAKNIEEATDSLVKETTTVETETNTRTETFGAPPKNGKGMGPGNWGNKTIMDKKKTTTKTEKIFNDKASNGAFTLLGYSSYDSMTDFVNGKLKIVDGEVSNDFTSNKCVISEELATLNDLSINDTITIVSPNDKKITYKLVISGIFKEDSDVSEDMTSMFSSTVNTIITNDKVVSEFMTSDKKLNATITPTFILKDKGSLEKFTNELAEKGLSEYYTVTNNLDIVEGATKSITNVKSFATMFLIITLIIGAIVLLVLNMINIRERKYEIGVLRTIGMKKSLVISQFMIELLIVALVGLLLGSGVGSLSSVKVANNLLKTEIKNAANETENIDKNFGGKGNMLGKPQNIGIAQIDQIDNIEAIVDFKVLAELLGIAVILTMISSLSACVAISRFSPLNILKERS